MSERCVVCGGTNGWMRSNHGLWYCYQSKPCWASVYDERSTYTETLKVELTCPFCKHEIGEHYMNSRDNKCPHCSTGYSTGYDDEVTFMRRVDQEFVLREEV